MLIENHIDFESTSPARDLAGEVLAVVVGLESSRLRAFPPTSDVGTFVWTGRALQPGFD
jgi:hypothetical protein